MRGKRAKQYRKLMKQYGLSFGFREPYQVIIDADMIRDADRFKMDLVGGLERTLCGKVKPMITQCSMRHLYALAAVPGISHIIDKAKKFERRRCGHIPSDYPLPLSAQSCIASVVDSKSNGNNKHRYVVASQDLEVRKAMRDLMGVPLVYINRGVMIMEPMAGKSVEIREREELSKLRAGIKRSSGGLKRKRDEIDMGNDHKKKFEEQDMLRKKTVRGPKGPNPLSVKKPKQKTDDEMTRKRKISQDLAADLESKTDVKKETEMIKKRRNRKRRPSGMGKKCAATSDLGDEH